MLSDGLSNEKFVGGDGFWRRWLFSPSFLSDTLSNQLYQRCLQFPKLSFSNAPLPRQPLAPLWVPHYLHGLIRRRGDALHLFNFKRNTFSNKHGQIQLTICISTIVTDIRDQRDNVNHSMRTYTTSNLRGLVMSSSKHTLANIPLEISSELKSTLITLPTGSRIFSKMDSFQSSRGSSGSGINLTLFRVFLRIKIHAPTL